MEVFNLEVADDHTYVANGVVVHNCDLLAQTDSYDMGPGVFPPDRWPARPHPFCGCMQGRALYRPPSQWDRPKPPSNPLAIDPTDDRFTASFADGWTENERGRNQEMFARAVAFGEQARRRSAA